MAANVQSICEGMELELFRLHFALLLINDLQLKLDIQPCFCKCNVETKKSGNNSDGNKKGRKMPFILRFWVVALSEVVPQHQININIDLNPSEHKPNIW